MTEDEGQPRPAAHPLAGQVPIEMGGGESRHLMSASSITASTIRRHQTWSVEYGQWEIDYETAAHQREMERDRLKHDLEQKKKDNDLRRFCLQAVLLLLTAALIVSAAVGVINEDAGTRQWGQNIATTILGGLVGAIAGYFAGKSGE